MFRTLCLWASAVLFLNGLCAQNIEQLHQVVKKKSSIQGLDSVSYVVKGDFNGDGAMDVAAIFERLPELDEDGMDTLSDEPRWLGIGFGRIKNNGLDLSFCEPIVWCRDCGGVFGDPLQGLSWEKPLLKLDYYGGSSLRWSFHFEFAYLKGEWVVVKKGEGNHVTWNLAYEHFETDLRDFSGSRSLTMPSENEDAEVAAEEVSTRFFAFFPAKTAQSIKIDGNADETAWRTAQQVRVQDSAWVTFGKDRWKSNADLSYDVKTLWDNDFLYVHLLVNDDALVPMGKDPLQLLKSDHVEFWFDFNPECVKFTEPKNDDELPVAEPRVKPTATTAQLALGFREDGGTIAKVWYPETGFEATGVQAATRILPQGGYQMEIALPMALLGQLNRSPDKDAAAPLPPRTHFTVVVSDNDNPAFRKQETLMSSSQLRWASPFSMGTIHLIEQFKPLLLKEIGY